MTAEDRTLVREIACMAGSLWYLTVKGWLMQAAGQSDPTLAAFTEQGERALQTFWQATGEGEVGDEDNQP